MKQNIIITLLSVICGILGYIAANIKSEVPKTNTLPNIQATKPSEFQKITKTNENEIIDYGLIKGKLKPQYTKESLENEEEGSVVVEIIVNKNGIIESAKISHSSGHARLDYTAIKTAKNEKLEPQTKQGKPIRTRYLISYTFNLAE